MGDVYYLLKLNILLRSYLITNLLVKYGRVVLVYNLKGFRNWPIKNIFKKWDEFKCFPIYTSINLVWTVYTLNNENRSTPVSTKFRGFLLNTFLQNFNFLISIAKNKKTIWSKVWQSLEQGKVKRQIDCYVFDASLIVTRTTFIIRYTRLF